jgi:hypothetical protein
MSLPANQVQRIGIVAAGGGKHTGMRQNLAGMPGRAGTSSAVSFSEKQDISMDRRVSVAPMMDWSDARHSR